MPQDNMEIYSILLDRIIELEYQPGELLNEKKLIEEFKVSRTPIREALLKLSEKYVSDNIDRLETECNSLLECNENPVLSGLLHAS